MKLKHLKSIVNAQPNEARVSAMDWSPNHKKFAICTSERVIVLFDEKGDRRDRFATKPADSKYGKKNYTVTAIGFSSDSTKLAVAQSDNIIYVYKIGDNWDDKKAICNKFPQPSSVTSLVWPMNQPIVVGLTDGKVRLCNTKVNKSNTVYQADSFVISLAINILGKGFVSGHADGSIIRYFLDDASDSQGKLATHSCPPTALAWGASNTILAAGYDKRIYVYGRDGRVLQQFDFSRDLDENEFSCATRNPSGLSVAIGSFDRIRIFNWSSQKSQWEEGIKKDVRNLYTISSMSWKKDGGKLCLGTATGAVEMMECCLKKVMYKGRWEMNYVGTSQVVVSDTQSKRSINVMSNLGYEINEVKVMGKERFVVGRTDRTLIVGELDKGQTSEFMWKNSPGIREKFIFDHENVCLIYRAGELNVIEYGQETILGCVRTEFVSPYHISVRVNERKQLDVTSSKKLAYLLDLKTIAIMDFNTGFNQTQIYNNSKIDWIELNETGTYLLFRDRKLHLQLCKLDSESPEKMSLLNFCSYVQWVPGSDVVVAQTSQETICVWYNLRSGRTDEMVTIPVQTKGDVVDIERHDGVTEVIVSDGEHRVAYPLDEGLIEFQTALEDGDFGRAIIFLESLYESGSSAEQLETMWLQLAERALMACRGDRQTDEQLITVAERCYAALGDVAKARYLEVTRDILETCSDHEYYKVSARLAILGRNFKDAEMIYLNNNQIELAIDMYKMVYMWEDAIYVASVKGQQIEQKLRSEYYDWLMKTNQLEKAGEIKAKDGNYLEAVGLYLKAGYPTRAARLVNTTRSLLSNTDLVTKISQALMRLELYDKAGELYENIDNVNEAMRCYRKGNIFQKAVELARVSFPEDVLRLEEEWGNYLVKTQQMDNAIQHFIESGSYKKALDAAVSAQQWQKVATILENQSSGSGKEFISYYKALGQHYCSVKKMDRAEQFLLKGQCYKEVVVMYADAGIWEKAYSIGKKYMEEVKLNMLMEKYCQQMEAEGRLKEAEKLYLTMDKSKEAIEMYKRHNQQPDAIRLINRYNPEQLDPTIIRLAEEAERDGNHRQAEKYYMELGDWKAALNMYRKENMWEDAYRVSQNADSPDAAKQVAYMWAKHLGGDSAVKLLNRLGLLEKAIDYACEHSAFAFAFQLAKHAPDSAKSSEIYTKYAMSLEDEGKFPEAEAAFIKAKKPREAVLMWVHQQDWDAAQRVAEKFDSESVSDVLVGQARFAFNSGDYKKAESYLIRAQRPELSVKLYKDNGMWQDALRVCREYVPHKLDELQKDYEREMSMHHNISNPGGSGANQNRGATGGSGGSSNQNYIEEARQAEINRQYLKAAEYYLKVTDEESNSDPQLLEKAWVRAGEVALKHLPSDKASMIIDIVCPRLARIKKFVMAAELYKAVDKVKEAINILIEGEQWDKAKELAREVNPKYTAYIDDKYKKSLKSAGKAAELENLDIVEALNVYAEQGNWDKCLNMASRESNPQVLHKYLSQYATQLIKSDQSIYAIQLYNKYGASFFPQNFNIYKRLFKDIVSSRELYNDKAYHVWEKLRDFLFKIYQDMMTSSSQEQDIIFERMLAVAHLYATRSALMSASNQNVKDLLMQISISLLRFSDLIPADKAFYEAGMACRENNQLNMAFVFLNRYLDLAEAIDDPDGSGDFLDNTEFEDTDIPLEVALPSDRFTSDSDHSEVKEWVLSVSMDQQVEPVLPRDSRSLFIGTLSPEAVWGCIVTGFPVSEADIQFKNRPGTFWASRDSYHRLSNVAKLSRSPECASVLQFIQQLCGHNL